MNPITGIVSPGVQPLHGLTKHQGLTVPSGFDAPMTLEEQQRMSFRNLLLGSLHEVNMLQQNADKAVETLMTGGEIGTAEVLTAVQKADIAFKMMMQMRNKLVGAFQEIQNIRV